MSVCYVVRWRGVYVTLLEGEGGWKEGSVCYVVRR